MAKKQVWVDLYPATVRDIVARAEVHTGAFLQASIIEAAIALVDPDAHKARLAEDWPERMTYLEAVETEAAEWSRHVTGVVTNLPEALRDLSPDADPPAWTGCVIITLDTNQDVRLGLNIRTLQVEHIALRLRL
jgi:hypothetical protein